MRLKDPVGVHYTSTEDILLVIEPVLMQPLLDERQGMYLAGKTPKNFSNKIASMRILDPACGTGNFLCAALQQLLDFQKEVITSTNLPLTVSPEQLYGIEIDPDACETASARIWNTYIQWLQENDFDEPGESVLDPLRHIECKDAILTYDKAGKPIDSEWPEVDVVIGNPPFMGGHKMRVGLGDKYTDDLRKLYKGRILGASDLVCYWFERTRMMIEAGNVKRAGLIATNSIRGGANRKVLERIKETGDIFMAWSDRPWE